MGSWIYVRLGIALVAILTVSLFDAFYNLAQKNDFKMEKKEREW